MKRERWKFVYIHQFWNCVLHVHWHDRQTGCQCERLRISPTERRKEKQFPSSMLPSQRPCRYFLLHSSGTAASCLSYSGTAASVTCYFLTDHAAVFHWRIILDQTRYFTSRNSIFHIIVAVKQLLFSKKASVSGTQFVALVYFFGSSI